MTPQPPVVPPSGEVRRTDFRTVEEIARQRSANWRRPPAARVIEVIEVVFLRGDGIEPDPVRQVTAYYAPDGTLLAENDPVTP